MNFWKKCPLLIFLLFSGVIISVVSLANMDGAYQDFEKETALTPALAAFFWGIKEEKYPWTVGNGQTEQVLALGNGETGNTVKVPGETEPEADDDEWTVTTAEADGDEQTAVSPEIYGDEQAPASPERDDDERIAVSSEEEEISGNIQETGEKQENVPDHEEELSETAFEIESETEAVAWQLGRVEEEYFDDALFIGDSRTQGLYEYGGFGESVTFYCKTSLTIYDLFKKEKAFIKEDGRNITLEQALTEHSFKKIYLMIGINEIGTGTAESFFEEYARTVFRIQQLQPEAVIFVQGIMRVGAQKNATDPIFNNTNIAIRNVEIQTLADGQKIFYIDVNEVVCDENGNLFEGWSSDQIHLKAKYYAVWKEFLMNHGAVPAFTDQ